MWIVFLIEAEEKVEKC